MTMSRVVVAMIGDHCGLYSSPRLLIVVHRDRCISCVQPQNDVELLTALRRGTARAARKA